jgi:hypothetical protein
MWASGNTAVREQQVRSEGPLSRLEALRFVRRVVEQQALRQLELIDRWIAQEERREAERRRGEEMRPAPPDWLLEHGLNGPQRQPVYVHAGACWNAGDRSRPVTREQALHALQQQVPACSHCRPDTILGYLE